MKAFFKNIFVFITPILLVLCAVELQLREMKTVYKWKYDNLKIERDSVQMIVLGNSHALHGINPQKFDFLTFNLAQTNQSLYFDKRLTLLHAPKMQNLKLVVITIDFHSLYFSSQGARDLWGYYETGIEYKNRLDPLEKNIRVLGYTPIVSLGMIRKSFINPDEPVDRENLVTGFISANKGWCYFEGTDPLAMNQQAYKNRANTFNNVVRTSVEHDQNFNDLRDFVEQLKAKKINIVLVSPPVHTEFLKMLDPNIRQKNRKDIEYLAKQTQVSFFDYSGFKLEDKYFFNCDHLNRAGADLFSKSLNDTLRSSRAFE